MDHSNIRIGGGADGSTIHPVVLVLTLVAAVLILMLPRKYVVMPFLLTVFLTPFGEQIYVASVHIFVPRILILIGCIRICWVKLFSQEQIVSGGFNGLDKLFLAWAIVRSLATFLEFTQLQAVINQCAFLWDVLGGYFLLRYLVRDEEDFARVVKVFAFIAIVLSVTMTGEKLFDRNVFGYIGGNLIPHFRDGAIRAGGTLAGPIQTGTFGATLICLFAWLWTSGRARLVAILGIIGATVMVVTSASSTPLLTWLAAILAISLWPIRKSMRAVRWGLVIFLILLNMVMKAPVWFIINHVDLIAGNSGDHRAMLIDGFIRHFSEWWLIGVKSTNSWGWDMWDQANQFVTEGESGGLLTFILFVWMVSWCFSRVAIARKVVEGDRKKEWMFWLLGGTVFAYVVSFFGISFSDQAQFAWYTLFAIISALAMPVLATNAAIEPQPTAGFAVRRLAYSSPSAVRLAQNRLQGGHGK